MKKILFISHDASRTGAPIVLFHFLKWLKINQPEIQADLLVLKGGNLENDFKEVASNYFDYEIKTTQKRLNRKERILLKLGWLKKSNLKDNLFLELSQNNYDVVYANTIASIKLAFELVSKNNSAKFIAHLHELNAVIKLILPDFKNYVDRVDQFITPAKMVKANLVSNWGVPENKTAVVYEFALMYEIEKQNKKGEEFIIGASGTVHWRKGHDVFIQVARYMYQHHPAHNFKFIWVGQISKLEQVVIEEDLIKLGLKDKVIFVGEVENPENYYKDFDVFLMTSREDPFPLVCIEVGMMGKPIISFDKAVGTNEILEQGGGFIVPYLDIETMGNKVLEYYMNPDLISEHGAFNKTVFSKFTPELISPQLFSIIKKNCSA
ncbi:glycosyltransferase family 4 protein [Flavobacterium aquicola]|uniref:Glycosyltransferase involved in cell wall biosynthesis n=1 Tax=Flavobacterium aquicola TaxID=1682742 RepID=A0A3E0EJ23_9FLAO|nr:glycosyltransferase family 4 protein [Flavobacterium aquicola]REG98264.1 glycosyltransferase involved in cell wall biosynthesis [Flavobacterium aquicola]